MTRKFRLRFPIAEIPKYASRYDYPGEGQLIAGPVARTRRRGHLTYKDFIALCNWKSPRNRKRFTSNPSDLVKEVTGIALSPSTSPKLAIEILTLLSGVGWPTASVILHFCHRDAYPILDFRALWSVSADVPTRYTYEFWELYVKFTRQLARRAATDMRTLDRALWKYSELHRPSA